MENVFTKAEELTDNIKEYIQTRIDEVKLEAAEKGSGIIANFTAAIAVAVVFLFFLVFASIALSIALGEWLDKMWAGFLIVACFYLLIGIIVWAGRMKMIQLPVANALIKQLFKNDDEEDQ